MNNLTLFKAKTFLYYLIVEPWTEKVSLPNFRSLLWALILMASIYRLTYLLFISLGIGIVLHLVYEYKSGKFIYWYRKYQKKKYGVIKGNGGGDDKAALPEMPENQTSD